MPNSNSATRAIGYGQDLDYLLRSREERGWSASRDVYNFLSEFQKSSRNFAKRQLTWFRNEPIYKWINAPWKMFYHSYVTTTKTKQGTLKCLDLFTWRRIFPTQKKSDY